jgi:hypothetical protein
MVTDLRHVGGSVQVLHEAINSLRYPGSIVQDQGSHDHKWLGSSVERTTVPSDRTDLPLAL